MPDALHFLLAVYMLIILAAIETLPALCQNRLHCFGILLYEQIPFLRIEVCVGNLQDTAAKCFAKGFVFPKGSKVRIF